MTIEASWVHMSHDALRGRQNPGMDNFGVRLSVQLPLIYSQRVRIGATP